MRKIASTILMMLISFSFLSFAYSADENQDELTTEFNFFTGMFDFSDDKQASPILGLQHQNEELFLNTGILKKEVFDPTQENIILIHNILSAKAHSKFKYWRKWMGKTCGK